MNPSILDTLRSNAQTIRISQERLNQLCTSLFFEITHFSPAADDPDNLLSLYRKIFLDPVDIFCLARFCRFASQDLSASALVSRFLRDATDNDETVTNQNVAYLQTPLTDRAFSVFSSFFKPSRLSAQYFPSFNASCEEVLYNRCRFCILPVWHSTDGFLLSFHQMISRHDLKILHTADISTPDGEITSRCALLSRNISCSVPHHGFFQITAVLPDDLPLGKFLCACEETGASVAFTHTVPLTYADDQSAFTLCFRVTENTTAPLLLFLSAVLKSYTADGLYTSITPNS